MKVRLKPLSHPQLGDIEIDSSLFAIGRREEPFTRLEQDAAKLSRRHARMFVENGMVYLADLQSLNGTRVNGRVLGTDAQVLAEGDMVDFGGAITFKVEIDSTEIGAQHAATLILKPSQSPELESIVIERFPYMVNRDDPIFSQHKESMPDEVKRISRRHALFALNKGQICIEDLDSSNGTFINDQRMDEHAQILTNGDVVRFGGQKFVYLVQIKNEESTQDHDATVLWAGDATPGDQTHIMPAAASTPAQNEPEDSDQPLAESVTGDSQTSVEPAAGNPDDNAQPAPAVDDSDKTRFVESPTSFLDVFCAPAGEDDQPAAPEAQAPKPERPRTGKVGQFGEAIGIGRYKKIAGVLVLALAIIGAVAGGTYWLDSDKRKLKTLVENRQYNEAVALASKYLAANKEDFDATSNGEKALVRATVPTWAEMLDSKDYQGAELYVADAYPPAKTIGRGVQMLDLLTWVSRVQKLFDERGRDVSIVDDELVLQSLVSDWDTNQYQNRQLIAQMISYDPAFEPYAASAMSRLVQLRNNDATFGEAISKLKRSIINGLEGGRLNDIGTALDSFATIYPTVDGIAEYRGDLERYRRMLTSFQANNLFELARINSQGGFTTETFTTFVGKWLENTLPSDALIETYEKSAEQWRGGYANDAITTLELILPIAQDGLGSEAQVKAKIARYQAIDAAYQSWQEDNSVDALLELRGLLQEGEDTFYLQASAEAFAQQRHVVVNQLDQTLRRAKNSWALYQQEGGIPGLVRLEPNVSARYETQAKRLKDALSEIQLGGRQQEMLGIERDAEWSTLEVDIVNEIKRQRLWLSELRLVMNAEVLAKKLALLPQI